MVKFHLDNKGASESPIFLGLYHRGKRIKVFTGKKIEASKWDVKTCRANPRKYKTNAIGFNQFLQLLSDEVEKLVNENRHISKSDLRLIVDKALGRNTKDSFFGFAEAHVKSQIEKGDLEPGSAKPYQGTINHLRSVAPGLTFNAVDLNFYDRFVMHLNKAGLSTNSIGGHVKRLKWFMAAALDRDLHSNVTFKKKAFEASREESDQIYLTRTEIKTLAKAKLPDRLQRVADAFVLNCHLGMRFSDLLQIQPGNFHKDGGLYFLNMIQDKTNEKISIPVPPNTIPLLRKYGFSCPVASDGKLISVQKFNDYIKEAAKLAGLSSEEEVRIAGEKKKVAKWELTKSHTARRSFATNLYLEGVPVQNIMAVTGHRKEETFLLYVRADQLTKSKGLAEHYRNKGKKKPVMRVNREAAA